ncbi:MAG: FAD-dependent oxidoreductase [Lysobacterales bacterium]
MQSHRSAVRIALLLGLVAIGCLFFALDLDRLLTLDALKERQLWLQQAVDRRPLLAMATFFVGYVLATTLFLPGTVILTIASGVLFGWLRGTLLVSFASTLGATLAFWASRYLFRDLVERRFGDRLAAVDAGIRAQGAYYLFSLRLIPLIPFFLVNPLMGLTRMRTGVYVLVSQLGMLPVSATFVLAGTQLAAISTPRDILSPGLLGTFALLGVLPMGIRQFLKRLSAARVYRGQRKPKRFDYNLVVIGAGSAGLVSAYIAATVRARVLLIERHKMGGDCLNTGCVPSKALLRSARLLAEARDSHRFGIASMRAEFDFAAVMERVQRVIAKVEPHDSVERYQSLGVEVTIGEARLVSPWEVEVGGRRVSARSIIIASGARPLVPRIPGLDQVDALTSDSVWGLRELPANLLVLGGGPIGCELTQAFARFGAKVTQVEMAPRLLPREDADAAAEVARQFAHEGIDVRTAHKALRVEKAGAEQFLVCEHQGAEVRLPFDRILLALGRRPNTEGFGLQELGVAISPRGTIEADALLATNFPNIFVCGDVAGPYQFTHTAAHQAWFAAVNALIAPFWSFPVDYRVIPWATFTEPEVARVGLSEDEAQAQNIAVEVTRYGIDDLDRAIADGADEGFVKVLTAPGSDRILGASIVGAHAGELLAEFVLAMKHGIGLNKILGTIHTYPTMAEANKYVAGNWKRAHAPQAALRFAERFFRWRRG